MNLSCRDVQTVQKKWGDKEAQARKESDFVSQKRAKTLPCYGWCKLGFSLHDGLGSTLSTSIAIST